MAHKEIWLPVEEVARRQQRDVRTIRRYTLELDDYPKPVRRGRRYYYSLKELIAFEQKYSGFDVKAA